MRKQYESAFILRDETLNGFQNETLYELLPTLGETGQGHPPAGAFAQNERAELNDVLPFVN
jgi:hypothetical protein